MYSIFCAVLCIVKLVWLCWQSAVSVERHLCCLARLLSTCSRTDDSRTTREDRCNHHELFACFPGSDHGNECGCYDHWKYPAAHWHSLQGWRNWWIC